MSSTNPFCHRHAYRPHLLLTTESTAHAHYAADTHIISTLALQHGACRVCRLHHDFTQVVNVACTHKWQNVVNVACTHKWQKVVNVACTHKWQKVFNVACRLAHKWQKVVNVACRLAHKWQKVVDVACTHKWQK